MTGVGPQPGATWHKDSGGPAVSGNSQRRAGHTFGAAGGSRTRRCPRRPRPRDRAILVPTTQRYRERPRARSETSRSATTRGWWGPRLGGRRTAILALRAFSRSTALVSETTKAACSATEPIPERPLSAHTAHAGSLALALPRWAKAAWSRCPAPPGRRSRTPQQTTDGRPSGRRAGKSGHRLAQRGGHQQEEKQDRTGEAAAVARAADGTNREGAPAPHPHPVRERTQQHRTQRMFPAPRQRARRCATALCANGPPLRPRPGTFAGLEVAANPTCRALPILFSTATPKTRHY